jgi:hypothetical protein
LYFGYPASPQVIRLAKSDIRVMYLQYEPENWICQRTNSCETDFANSIKYDEDPGCRDGG